MLKKMQKGSEVIDTRPSNEPYPILKLKVVYTHNWPMANTTLQSGFKSSIT